MTHGGHAGSNPFASRHIRPGALPYQFPPGDNLSGCLARLAGQRHWGQIVGPHGTGKSTLLHTLLPALESQGQEIVHFALQGGQRRLPEGAWQMPLSPRHIVVVDGYEQLGPWTRWKLQRRCRRRGAGLIVTSHRDLGLPLLMRTAADTDLVWDLVETLTDHRPPCRRHAVESLLAAHQGNVREVLFSLYDLCEGQAAANAAPAADGCRSVVHH